MKNIKIAMVTLVFLGINELTYLFFTSRTLNSSYWITMDSIQNANVILILFINYVGNNFFELIKNILSLVINTIKLY